MKKVLCLLLLTSTVALAEKMHVETVEVQDATKAGKLRQALQKDGVEAVARVKKAKLAVRKQLVGPLLDTYLNGGRDAAEAARSLLLDMGRKSPKAVVPKVGHRFRKASPDEIATRLPLMDLLWHFGPHAELALPAVVEGLKSDDLNIQQQAVWVASAIRSPAKKAVKPLCDLLDSRDALLREDAAEALTIIGVPSSAVDQLVKALDSEDEAVWEFALGALKEIGTDAAEAVPALIKIVKKEDRFTKMEAVEALGAMGPSAEKAVPVLLDLAEGRSERMKEAVQVALDKIKTENMAPVVQDDEVACDEGGSVKIKLPAAGKDDTVIAFETTVVQEPEHGSLKQMSEIVYVYNSSRGFAGQDSFGWKVSDGEAESSEATIKIGIKPDKTAPKVMSVTVVGERDTVKVRFSEPVQKSSAADAGSYRINKGIKVKKARLKKGARSVVLNTSQLSARKKYALRVEGIRDRSAEGNAVKSTATSFIYYAWRREGLALLSRADGNARDESGKNNHGKLNKGVSYSSDAVGGKAFKFAGVGGESNNTVSFGDIGALNGPGHFTIAFWFKRTKNRSGHTRHKISNVMFSKGSDSNNDNMEIGSQGSKVEVYFDSAGLDGAMRKDVGLKNGQWYHLVLTYDKGRKQEAQIYLDGKKAAALSAWKGNVNAASGSPVTVGNTHHHENPFQGLIDEVFVFGRVLEKKEIKALSTRR